MKKERLYKQLLSLKKCHRKLVKTELQNIKEVKADEHLFSDSLSASNLIFSASVRDFNLALTFFN